MADKRLEERAQIKEITPADKEALLSSTIVKVESLVKRASCSDDCGSENSKWPSQNLTSMWPIFCRQCWQHKIKLNASREGFSTVCDESFTKICSPRLFSNRNYKLQALLIWIKQKYSPIFRMSNINLDNVFGHSGWISVQFQKYTQRPQKSISCIFLTPRRLARWKHSTKVSTPVRPPRDSPVWLYLV